MKRGPKTVRLTVEQCSVQIGCSKETLRRGLKELGCALNRGARYDLAMVFRALASDAKAERTRLTRTQADILEIEKAEKERQLAPLSDALAYTTQAFASAKQALLAMSQEIASRCNPSDPDLARVVIHDRVSEILTSAAEALTKEQ